MRVRIMHAAVTAGFFLTLSTSSPLLAADPVNIQISMPSLSCGKGGMAPDECILNGTMRLRGAETLNGPIRYFCSIRYNFIAAGNEKQAIRFSERVIYHGEAKLEKGRGRKELAEPLTLKLSQQARQIEITEIDCERE